MFRLGRINRTTYWFCAVIMVGLYVLIGLASSRQTGISEIFLVGLAVPRLHDIGKSAWWAGGIFLAEIALAIIAFVTLPMNAALMVLGFFVILVAGLMILLGLMPGQPDANRFGEPPPRGISYRSLQTTPPADHFN